MCERVKRVMIGFSFNSDWMTKWREFLSQSCASTFDTQVNAASFLFTRDQFENQTFSHKKVENREKASPVTVMKRESNEFPKVATTNST